MKVCVLSPLPPYYTSCCMCLATKDLWKGNCAPLLVFSSQSVNSASSTSDKAKPTPPPKPATTTNNTVSMMIIRGAPVISKVLKEMQLKICGLAITCVHIRTPVIRAPSLTN